jgi:hypothetical protein
VLALLIVKAKPGTDAGLGLGDRRIGVEVNFLVFEAAPQPLDEDVVHAAALAVHADHDAVVLQGAGEIVAGEVATLVRVENFGLAVLCQRLLQSLDAKVGAERVRLEGRVADPEWKPLPAGLWTLPAVFMEARNLLLEAFMEAGEPTWKVREKTSAPLKMEYNSRRHYRLLPGG